MRSPRHGLRAGHTNALPPLATCYAPAPALDPLCPPQITPQISGKPRAGGAGLWRPLMALLLFGFESIRPSPSFLPGRARHPAPASPHAQRPSPSVLAPFPSRHVVAALATILTARRGAGWGRGPRRVMQMKSLPVGWSRDRGGGAGGKGRSRQGAERRGAALVPPPPRPLSALRRRASRAPRLGLPERPRPVPARRARPPRRRAPPLYSWRRGEPGVCSCGRGGGGGWRGVGGAGGGIGSSSSSSSSHRQQQPWVPRRHSPRRLPHCLTRPASPASALGRPLTRPRPCAPAAARAATPPAV